ncbi:Alpha/Beta hydrolase protein [Penicillium malachiteum]|uniref:Alpha/Beta hydrolase protein n=1 Tax=Penicillium malachiteum TaxID=1324776 RepID=UPI002546737F|nr:Alpha/Beta hydrolase protein [Penicillium malachiteum]KAJ5713153.1 Alpha/Beta hydrolase protein [Penicillium malachiteum]
MSVSECCTKGFKWDGEPKGHETSLSGNNTYVTGTNSSVAILVIHDLFGWTFPNIRLLADSYAEGANATVYAPDFFGGEVLPSDIVSKDPSEWGPLDLAAFSARNSKEVREPEIVAFAKALRAQYKRVAAIGFCYGGWAVFRLGAKANAGLVDCISTAHPSWLTQEEIQDVGVPVQIMAPEIDPIFTTELREFANRVIPSLGLAYDLQYFPGLEHSFAVRGNRENEAEMKGLERAKDAAVHWLKQWLH